MNVIVDAGMVIAQRAAPYLRYAFAAIQIIETEAVPIAASDRYWRVYINPSICVDAEQMAWLLLHEVGGHLVRGHHAACELSEDPQRLNVAMDLEIESWEWRGLQRLPGGAHPTNHGLPVGETWQWYWDHMGSAHQSYKQLDCGSGAHGHARPWEIHKAREDLNAPLIRAAQIATASAIAKAPPGSVPAGLSVWADATLAPPPVNWREQLRCVLAAHVACGATDMTGPAKERRGVLVRLWRSLRPKVAVIADTSGSMRSEGGTVIGACVDIVRTVGDCDICWVDTEPTWQRGVRSRAEMRPVGGGGTNFISAIEQARERRYDATLIITDGECSWPASAEPNESVLLTTGGVVPPPQWRLICQ